MRNPDHAYDGRAAMSYSPSSIKGMGVVDPVTGRAIVLGGRRNGYHPSHVITPYIAEKATAATLRAFELWRRYNPEEPVVWRLSGRHLYWVTLKAASLEDELLKMARRRERGLRQSIATLARWTGASRDLVARTLRSLAKRGMGTLTTERGRYAKATFRVLGINHAANVVKAAGLEALSSEERDARFVERYRKRYSEEEWAELMAQGELWRYRLALHLSELGFDGPNAQTEYLRFMGHTGELRLS
jgi:hypothetical protein